MTAVPSAAVTTPAQRQRIPIPTQRRRLPSRLRKAATATTLNSLAAIKATLQEIKELIAEVGVDFLRAHLVGDGGLRRLRINRIVFWRMSGFGNNLEVGFSLT